MSVFTIDAGQGQGLGTRPGSSGVAINAFRKDDGGGPPPPVTFYWRLEDGSGYWELEDGSGNWLLENAP